MREMKVSDWISVIAGLFVLTSVLLGMFVHGYFFYFTIFVGANLFQSGFTGFCPMAIILKKLGVKQ